MTFLSERNLTKENMQPGPAQRGRSSVEFLGALQNYSSRNIRPRAFADFEADPEGHRLNEAAKRGPGNQSWSDINNERRAVAERSINYRYERFYQRLVAEELWIRSIQAVEGRRAAFETYLNQPAPDVGCSLELDPNLAMPDYYAFDWHLEPGGWDGYDLYGPLLSAVAGPMVFRLGGFAAVGPGDDPPQQRLDILNQLPKTTYGRIYEPGCGGVSTLVAAHELFPDAELIGCDLSPLLLRMGYTTASRLGFKAQFKQRDARATGEADASVDAVVIHALMHELPLQVSLDILKEMHRILKPGGDIIVSDPPPFRAVAPLHAVMLDWDTKHRGEPHFSLSCEQDWGAHLEHIGFKDVSSVGLGKNVYPYVTKGTKVG